MTPNGEPLGSGRMFDGIAERYDLVNRVISLGIDMRWRRRAVRALSLEKGARVLDVATGTADLAILTAQAELTATVVGIDPSERMLDVGREKIARHGLSGRVELRSGDAEALPFDDASFDAVSIAFGIRNVPDRDRALGEMARVTRPGGRVVVLELSEPPPGLMGPIARFHMRTLVPYVGGLISGASEYKYLVSSIIAFPPADEFEKKMERAGMRLIETDPLTFGVCHLYVAEAGEGGVSAALEESRPLGVDPGTLERALTNALEKPVNASLLVVSIPAPVRPSETLLAGTKGPALAWAAPWGFELAGLGEAASLEGRGPERFREVARAGGELLAGVRSVGLFGVEGIQPRLFGGFAFRAGAPKSRHWAPFGEARFVLPELGYFVDAGEGRLFVAMSSERLAQRAERQALVGRALEALETLERGHPQAPAPERSPATLSEGPLAEWMRLVEAIGAEIARGTLEKVVLARRVSVDLPRPLDPAHVLARLRSEAPESTRFLVRREGSVFLGATPERLAKRSGASLETEAVAGSISTLDHEAARHLFESSKDLAEHALVVREIERALEPLAERIETSARPELYELRHVLHLRTRIQATLKDAPHLLEVVERLHPTPAVGGVPTARALEWIANSERDERGWYAGPIGWFDLSGNGEMAVALRSGVLEETRAHLYVGAGIVEHSVPQDELAETRWKLQTLLSALGIRGD